jgi:hypothetical protein
MADVVFTVLLSSLVYMSVKKRGSLLLTKTITPRYALLRVMALCSLEQKLHSTQFIL